MNPLAPPCFRAFPIGLALVAGACCWSTAAFAQSIPAAPTTTSSGPFTTTDTVRLTDEQRREILDKNTVESAAAARGELTEPERAERGIHGEIGVMIGSHGTRGAYGTAEIPLGDHAAATVSIESSRFGYRR